MSEGMKMLGTTDSQAGRALASAGDVNGDGLDDVLVGGPAAGSSTGVAWLVLGGDW